MIYYILSEEFEPFLVSSDPNCPLYGIDLIMDPVYDASGALLSYSDPEPFLTMETWGLNSNFNLRIETTTEL
jgi:hypothetical protein